MQNPIIVATLALAASAIGCASSAHPAASPQRVSLACNQLPADSQQVLNSVLTPGATFDARPIKEIRVRARASQEAELVGAQLQIPAPHNVSKEYLERVLTCHANSNVAAHDADPFHPSVGSVRAIDVKSEGATLAVQIRGSNKATNREILHRAERLSTPSSDVTIEQVGSTTSAPVL
jgi:hypothetical protein